ncbi:hypothetical protein H634G_11064 [Metarhizium anisopliae BRIP 53293]|uniref:Uncharacterized protein n=1 Tax=Metarhizium anisopliae BRIP 53293 TaxID=1291518 RepID=A0A0D9NM45_METAN|nr:hypothetical protein H634G_11064 [Metarhizium anisopliae BRIP 53293]
MSAATNHRTQAENGLPATSAQLAVDEFCSLVSKYFSQGGFNKLQALCQENENLKQNVSELSVTYKNNLRELHQNERELDSIKTKYNLDLSSLRKEHSQMLHAQKNRMEKECGARKAAEEKLQVERLALADKTEQVESLTLDVRRITETTKNGESRISQLEVERQACIEACELQKSSNGKLQSQLKDAIENMKSKSNELSEAQTTLQALQSFVVNLNYLRDKKAEMTQRVNAIFKDAEHFTKKLFDINLDEDHLTLMSESVRSQKYIFRPTYITTGDEIDDVLISLRAESPLQEAYIRAVLLKVPVLSKRRLTGGESHTRKVAMSMLDVVGALIPAEQRGNFQSDFMQLYAKAAANWVPVQQMQEAVHVTFHYDLPEDWKPLPIETENNRTSTDTASSKSIGRDRQRKILSPTQQQKHESIVGIVWPCFLAMNLPEGDSSYEESFQLIHPGYVLTKAQVEDAEQEEFSRRAARKHSRRSVPESVVTQRARRMSAGFSGDG